MAIEHYKTYIINDAKTLYNYGILMSQLDNLNIAKKCYKEQYI